MTFSSIRKSVFTPLLSVGLVAAFMTSMVITPRIALAESGVIGIPKPGEMVNLSQAYVPLMLSGLTVHPENPLLMDFIVSTGNSGVQKDQVKQSTDRLIKYFLACLTIPENNQWVNLSPYEKQRVIPDDLGQTVLGQDMLAQDYLLKQLTASLIYPERNLGKNFWDKVYKKAFETYGTTQIPVNTFNKVWILPDTSDVYTHNNTVFVTKSHLKVMLDEDYLALSKHNTNAHADHNISSQIIRQIVLPAIEEEVNTGKNFAQLRQIYNSMILAFWYKTNLKQALLNQVYTDKSKVNGVNVSDPAIKEKIYQQYVKAYRRGVFNYIKEDRLSSQTSQTITRKYFSGGIHTVDHLGAGTPAAAMQAVGAVAESDTYRVRGITLGERTKSNAAMSFSSYHESRAREILNYANEADGALPMPTHSIERMFGVNDVPLNLMNLTDSEKKKLWQLSSTYLQELSQRNGHITWGPMAGGSASRMAKGKLTKILTEALKQDPEQFVDESKFNDKDREAINARFEGDFRAYVKSLNPEDDNDHEVLNRILYEAKALLPADWPIDGKWYNLLAFNAINVKRINDELEAKGLKRVFIFKVLANDGNYKNILKNLVKNNFYGLKVSVIKDEQGNVVDIDHSDITNEMVMYNQGMGYRLVAPLSTVKALKVKDDEIRRKASTEIDENKKQTLLASVHFKTDAAYQYALAFSGSNEGKVLYNTSVAEGHGERFHALFETTQIGPSIPMLIQDILRNVEYDYFHNIDNMASLNDDWMLILGHLLQNNLLMTLEASLRPSTERGGGGGFNYTYITNNQGQREWVYRQTEDSVTKASLGKILNGNPISPNYKEDLEIRVPVNNASEINKVPTLETIRKGEDIISANLSPELRKDLANTLEEAIRGGNYTVDLTRFSNALRNSFGVLSTLKTVGDPNVKSPNSDQQIVSIVNETLAWDSQQGALPGQRMHVILTPSIVDVSEKRTGVKEGDVRFDPLKDRQTYDNELAQQVRGSLLKRVISGNLLSNEYLATFRSLRSIPNVASNAMVSISEAVSLNMGRLDERALDVLHDPEEYPSEFVGALNNVKGTIQASESKEKLEANLARLKAGEKIEFKIPVRLFDGSGSSFDLKALKRLVNRFKTLIHDFGNDKGFQLLPTLTAFISSMVEGDSQSLFVTVTIEKGEDGKITYVAPDYNVNQTTAADVLLNEKGRLSGGQKNAADFILGQLFGVTGVKVTLKLNNPQVIKSGGLESSNGFNAALFYAARELTGSNLTHGELFGIGLSTANGPLSDLTGLQGWTVDVFGNGQMIYTDEVRDKDGKRVMPGGLIFVPIKDADKKSGGLLLASLKKPDDDVLTRTATLINTLWTKLVDNDDEETIKWQRRMLELAHQYAISYMTKDIDSRQKADTEYVELRDNVTLRAINLLFDAHEGKQVPEFVKKFERIVFHDSLDDNNAYAKQFKPLREYYYKGNSDAEKEASRKKLRTQSIYSWGITQEMRDYMKEHHIAGFCLGAGGPGANWKFEAKADSPEKANEVIEEFKTKFAHELVNPIVPKIGNTPMQAAWINKEGKSDSINLLADFKPAEVKFAETVAKGFDAASVATAAAPGGIDLNAKNLSMRATGDKVNITFNPAMIAQFKRGDFSGIKFEVLEIIPFNPMPLLGLKEDAFTPRVA